MGNWAANVEDILEESYNVAMFEGIRRSFLASIQYLVARGESSAFGSWDTGNAWSLLIILLDHDWIHRGYVITRICPLQFGTRQCREVTWHCGLGIRQLRGNSIYVDHQRAVGMGAEPSLGDLMKNQDQEGPASLDDVEYTQDWAPFCGKYRPQTRLDDRGHQGHHYSSNLLVL